MNLNSTFVTALRRVSLKWRTRFDAELKRSGQTLGRARALILLSNEEGGMLQRDLAAELMIEHPTLVRLLDGLERQGLIRREPVAGSKRANRIVLTKAAGPVVREVITIFEGLRDRILCSVPDEHLEIALGVLDTIVTNLDSAGDVGKAPATGNPPKPTR
jgi:MarR family transcriptional regulator for hemolysin